MIKAHNMKSNIIDILLIEDNPHDAEITIRSLKKNKLLNNIIHIDNGEEALDFLMARGIYAGRDTNIKPKVVLLDLKMPKVDGLEVLVEIKKQADLKDIPIVILTSSKEHPDVQKCYELGVNSYIVKPVEFESFSTVIADLGFYWVILNHIPL